jgi:NADH-quinone oxidoreductase subunit C
MSTDQDKLIAELVEKGLTGDMEPINSIEDRVLRSKAKAALAKAKRAAKSQEPADPKKKKSKEKSSDDAPLSVNLNEKIGKMINEKFPGSLANENTETHIQLKPDHWFEIANWLKSEPSLFFDSLQCQTGIDVGDNTLEARYNFHSMKHNHYTEIRIAVPRQEATIPSVEQIWRIADWFERETYDMLGIEFSGHRDLRRILLPDDWEGWPLRKDYQVQETYHGIVVPKIKEGWE